MFKCIKNYFQTISSLRKKLALSEAEIDGLINEREADKDIIACLRNEIYGLERNAEHYEETISGLNNDWKAIQASAWGLLLTLKNEVRMNDIDIYEAVSPFLDSEGWIRYRIAQKMISINIYSHFYAEDCMGRFEMSDGNELLHWLELAKFGDIGYRFVGCYEVVDSTALDMAQPAYLNYCSDLHERTIAKLMNDNPLRQRQECNLAG